MDYAIIAAGEGSRLKEEGITTPKPLLRLGQETLIQRLIRIFSGNDAENIYVITGNKTPTVTEHISSLTTDTRHPTIHHLQQTTKSSMHSLHAMVRHLGLGTRPFILTTVDTVFSEKAFARFTETFNTLIAHDKADVLLGTTTYIDDEKPLYITTDSQTNVTGIHDTPPTPNTQHPISISAGIYALTPAAIPVLNHCVKQGEERMRNYQRALIKASLRVKAVDMGKVIDIDHKQDIDKAATMLHQPTP